MKTMARLRSTTEDDIARALASLSPASWPQDEKDLLVLFNRLLDMKIEDPLQRSLSHLLIGQPEGCRTNSPHICMLCGEQCAARRWENMPRFFIDTCDEDAFCRDDN